MLGNANVSSAESLDSNSGSPGNSSTSGQIQKVIHSYTANAGDAELRFTITIEPIAEISNEHRFFLSLKAGTIERPICKPITLKLSMHPRDLRFSVFLFPPKACLPAGCLWSLRVWVRANDIDHRLFSEDRLWVGRDPDFYAIEDAAFARLQTSTSVTKLYRVPLGRSYIDLTAKWRPLGSSIFSLILEYDGNGVGRVLFNDLSMRLECQPQDIDLIIYLLPVPSTPKGASHRLRVWLRAPEHNPPNPFDAATSSSRDVICQRIWGTDDFKVGHSLDFAALGSRMVMAAPATGGPAMMLTTTSELSLYPDIHTRSAPYSEFVNQKKEVL
ncbi:hypothetical protein OF83DRAFT_1235624 [Amylostereum chailletii]|nr:hypothetical protein OF83DRAFT_1235624 [Amylostereum chailletii]